MKTTAETPEKPEEVAIHNLFSREIRPIRNWNEWLERWQAAATMEEMIGLLHVGFSVSLHRCGHFEKEYDSTDRILFYFSITDGWYGFRTLNKPEDFGEYTLGWDENGNWIKKTPGEIRQMVATKAYEMLCQNFFKLNRKNNSISQSLEQTFMEIMGDEKLFPVILNFFRIQLSIGNRIDIRNLKSGDEDLSHNDKIVLTFLTELAHYFWSWKEMNIESWRENAYKLRVAEENAKFRDLISQAQPWMIEVLNHINRLDIVEKFGMTLDEICLEKLKEIALRSELLSWRHLVQADRKAESVEEAFFAGSYAAEILKLREIKISIRDHLAQIAEAEEARLEAEEKLKALSAKSRS